MSTPPDKKDEANMRKGGGICQMKEKTILYLRS